MDQVISLILFVVPGIFINLLYKEYTPRTKNEPTDYEKTVIAFIYSFAVLVMNISIMRFIFTIKIENLSQLMGSLKITDFLLKYVLLMLSNSIIFAIAWYYIKKYPLLKLYNIFRGKRGLSKQTRFSSVWDEIFENAEMDLSDTYVTIEKEGKLITQGLISLYSPIDSKEKEFKLICTDSFKAYLENDKQLPEDERIFNNIEFEYFNMQTGMLIKFYNNEKLKEYLSSLDDIT